MIMKNIKIFSALCVVIFLSSCGGGGGSSSPIAPPPVTQNPSGLACASYQTNTRKCSFTHNGVLREYYVYTPSSYTPSSNAPLLFIFHGYGSSATNILFYSDFQDRAEQDGFILVYPQGSLLNGVTHWNVGGWTIGSTVDDVGFTEDVIDIITSEYYINTDRIYSTGMSNGGYMSYGLACNSSKFAAIASVTGSMTPEIDNNCAPDHPMPVMQIHGLQEGTVLYTGASWSLSIPNVMEYWSSYNAWDEDPSSIITDLDNGSYILFDSYQNCSNNVGVELILHSTMGHTWPSLNSHSLSATDQIWSFFAKYDINGAIN
jgi:polyhydroxybutyrate depolymerase